MTLFDDTFDVMRDIKRVIVSGKNRKYSNFIKSLKTLSHNVCICWDFPLKFLEFVVMTIPMTEKDTSITNLTLCHEIGS